MGLTDSVQRTHVVYNNTSLDSEAESGKWKAVEREGGSLPLVHKQNVHTRMCAYATIIVHV